MANTRFGFIGAGRMATALAKGFVSAGLARPEDIVASDPSGPAAEAFTRATLCKATSDNQQAAAAEVLILAVKPQHMAEALAALKGPSTAGKLVISIAAGVTLATLA